MTTMLKQRFRTRLSRPAGASGRSLVELMVAVLIGTLVLAGVLIATSGASSSGQRTSALGRLTESGQVALQLIALDVRMAGFGKPFYLADSIRITKQFATAGIRGCDGVFTNIQDNTSAPKLQDLNCPASDNATDSASFAVTYEADSYNTIPVVTNEQIGDVPADCRGYGLWSTGGSALKGNEENQADAENPEARIWRVENRYWVEKDTDGVSVLRCSGNGGGTPFNNKVTLVTGVDRMVVTYGIGSGAVNDDGNDEQLVLQKGVIAYKTAKEIDEDANWSKEPPHVRWQRVISARVCVEIAGDVGSADRVADNDYGAFVNCNGQTTTITDGRQRRAVTMTMNLRNKTPVPREGVIGFGNV